MSLQCKRLPIAVINVLMTGDVLKVLIALFRICNLLKINVKFVFR
jgi:hypothetical protein